MDPTEPCGGVTSWGRKASLGCSCLDLRPGGQLGVWHPVPAHAGPRRRRGEGSMAREGPSLCLLDVKERPTTLGLARPGWGGTKWQQARLRPKLAGGSPPGKSRCKAAGPPGGSRRGRGRAAGGTVRQRNSQGVRAQGPPQLHLGWGRRSSLWTSGSPFVKGPWRVDHLPDLSGSDTPTPRRTHSAHRRAG